VSLKTTCNKNVEFKVVKIRTICQYVGNFCFSENLNRAVQNPLGWAARLDIDGLDSVPNARENINFEHCIMAHDKNSQSLKHFRKIFQTSRAVQSKLDSDIQCDMERGSSCRYKIFSGDKLAIFK